MDSSQPLDVSPQKWFLSISYYGHLTAILGIATSEHEFQEFIGVLIIHTVRVEGQIPYFENPKYYVCMHINSAGNQQ